MFTKEEIREHLDKEIEIGEKAKIDLYKLEQLHKDQQGLVYNCNGRISALTSLLRSLDE